ncbi:DUF1643 domain-containing protein [Pseudoprimorskyibacter insulae]|uniref:DUF1643 domain-containing protein n=1 Tax=Pseudoprimorskyibacter insulae TaxID=1695997 RepID=A0A2R8AVF5_9RHOB|nr:DUF1643 domain-containing protein [Pseudoprimorskyibacter insulae]SPF80003.1 hypothetical protein PRI8871_01805 [Pseudoprimorskyibacter insulae]
MTDWPLPDTGDVLCRRHNRDGIASIALYSSCETYRYGLARRWSDAGDVLFVMLNPSTATELRNDPTIERCERRARQLGHGGVMIANLFSFRATRPADLKAANHPVGDLNDDVTRLWHDHATMTIAAWGVHGAHLGRADQFRGLLPGKIFHLGLTKAGHPRHPLYVPYDTKPTLWEQHE